MNEDPILNYVTASAAMLSLPLDAAQAQRVAAHLTRTADMARMLDEVPIKVEDEPAALFCPAPFPQAQP